MNDERQWISAYLDGELSNEDERRLAEWLVADREHVRQFVRETQLHRNIREAMLARQFHTDALAAVERAERNLSPSPMRSLLKSMAGLLAFPWSPGSRLAWLPLAACLVLLLGLGIWFVGPAGEPALADLTAGGVTLERAGQTVAAAAGMRLQRAEVLRTGRNATAAITFGREPTRIELRAGTELGLTSFARRKHFDLRVGRLEAIVARQRVLRPMIISTPNAEARVLGTRFTLTAATNRTRLDVTEGIVRLTSRGDGKAVKVEAGSYAVVAAGHPLAALPITGKVLREVWRRVQGSEVHDLTLHQGFPDRPDLRDFPVRIETVHETNGTVGVRLRGYLIPDETDDYSFTLSASGAAALSLSEDDSPDNRVMIAQTAASPTQSGPVARRRFNATQRQSAPVRLEQGRAYYFEVLHVHTVGDGEPALRVVWTGRGGEAAEIPAASLAPFLAQRGARR